MNDVHDDLTRVLAALEEPEPPGALRERALARAGAAWERPAADHWLALWESRALRVAWAATVFLLVGANVVLRTNRPPHPRPASATVALRERAGLEELQAVVQLPRLRQENIGTDASGALAGRESGSKLTLPRHTKEDKS